MPMRRRTSVAETSGAVEVVAVVRQTLPPTRADGMRSFIRLRQRRTVVLPHPDGPMNEVISFLRMLHRDLAHGAERAVVHLEVVELEHRGRRGVRLLGRGIDVLRGNRRPWAAPCGSRDRVRRPRSRTSSSPFARSSSRPRRPSTRPRAGRAPSARRPSTIEVSAAPHARSWAPANGCWAFEKICADSAVFGPLNTFQLTDVAAPMVNSSGAVSPAARATASSTPLRMPGNAGGQDDADDRARLAAHRGRSWPRAGGRGPA